MREIPPPSAAVVVGIDGSRAAIDAALWAVREAVDRDVPLRLVSAIEPKDSTPGDGQTYSQDFGTAECAILQAVTAVESTHDPVKIEAEIMRCAAAQALLNASRSAAMICIGADGLSDDADTRRGGSTAAALSAQAHCPVAIVRRSASRSAGTPGWIVTCTNGDPGDTFVVARAVEEARLRSAPLRVLGNLKPQLRDNVHDVHAAAVRLSARKDLDRSIARWRVTNPGMVIESVELTGDFFDYVVREASDIQLIVVAHGGPGNAADVNRAVTNAPFQDLHCSVLITEPHHAQ